MDRHTVLRTARLVVTTWEPEDVDDLLALHSDPVTMRWVRHGRPETRAETQDLLATYIDEQRTRGWTKWRVTDATGELVGRAGFGAATSSPAADRDVVHVRELGYTLARSRWGTGLATELATGLVQWHREHADTAVLIAYAALENTASRRVLDKTGFATVGVATHNGVDCALYELAT